jgi:L-asparaginase
MTTTPLPKIAVIGTGGTISSLAQSSLDSLDYPEFGTKLTAAEVLQRVPEAGLVAEAQPVPFRAVGSTAIGPADWLELRNLLHKTAADQPDLAGFVILHGTATLEETAYFLNLTLAIPQTVVLVGAQRPASALGTDSGANLVAALRVAGAPAARGLGVLVVMNDEIHAARDVVKTSTYRLQTFRSLDFGALGHVDGDGVQILRATRRRHAPDTAFTQALPAQLPRVDIILSYAGVDGVFVQAAMAAGVRGIVSAGLAPGIATPAERAALEQAVASGVAVVQCSRAASGRVGRRRYLREAGMIAGEDLSPQKARILLMLALTQTDDPQQIAEMFATY